MFGFGKKPAITLGLDINSNTISVIQMEKTKTDLKVSRFASTLTPPDIVREGLLNDPEAVGQAIRELVESTGLQVKGKNRPRINVAIPGQAVVIRLLSVPSSMPAYELNDVVRQEAINNLPFSLDEANLDWSVVPGTQRTDPDGVEREDLILSAIQKVIVESYIRMAQASGLELGVLDVTSLSCLRSLSNAGYIGNDTPLSLVVNIRQDATDIVLVNRSIPLFTRSVLLGLETVAEAISRSIDASLEEALSLLPKVQMLGVPTVDPRLGQAAQVARSVFGDLTAEVGRSLEFYMSQVGMVQVDQVIVCGPGTLAPDLAQFVSNRLNLKAIIANPFENIIYDSQQIIDERRAFHTSLVGLVLESEWLASESVAIDLNKDMELLQAAAEAAAEAGYEEEGEAGEIETPWFIPAVVVGLVLALGTIAGWFYLANVMIPSMDQEIGALDTDIAQKKKQTDDLQSRQGEVAELEAKRDALMGIVKHGRPATLALQTIQDIIPRECCVLKLTLNGSNISLSGNTSEFKYASDFVLNMEDSGRFVSSDLGPLKRLKKFPRQIQYQIAGMFSSQLNAPLDDNLAEVSITGSSTPALTDSSSKAAIGARPRVLDFYADWCPPCRQIKPIMEELERRYGRQVEFVKLNVDDPANQPLAKQYGVNGIPAIFFLDGRGRTVNNVVGFRSAAELEGSIKKLLAQ